MPESAWNISGFPAVLEDRAACRRIGQADLAIVPRNSCQLVLLYRTSHAGRRWRLRPQFHDQPHDLLERLPWDSELISLGFLP
jgi:hypothetical protein